MELIESQALLEWLANNYKTFGATLEIITDKSQEGSQFVRGFGGVGGNYPWRCFSHHYFSHSCFTPPAGILRYKVDLQSLQGDASLDDQLYDLDDY